MAKLYNNIIKTTKLSLINFLYISTNTNIVTTNKVQKCSKKF